MDYRSFYESDGVDYDAFLQRMMGKEVLIKKYLNKFIEDPTFLELDGAIAVQDYDGVQQKTHTLKGIGLNLDLKKLVDCCIALEAAVKEVQESQMDVRYQELKNEYERIVSKLQN